MLMDSALDAINVSTDKKSVLQPLPQRNASRIPAFRSTSSQSIRSNNAYELINNVDISDSDSYESALQTVASQNETTDSLEIQLKRSTTNVRAAINLQASSKSNQNNSANDDENQTTTPIVPLTHTQSAPAQTPLTNEINEKKRRRTDGSSLTHNDDLTNTNVDLAIKQHVSFAPQNVDAITGITTTTSTTNADACQGEVHDMATGPNDKAQRTVINPMADPMWTATRKHLIMKLKANLRFLHLKGLLDDDIMPIEFFGGDLMHRYYASNLGVLSTPMQELLGRHARERANLVLGELMDTAKSEKVKVDYYIHLTEQIYLHEEDTSFPEARKALARVTAFYEKTERERLDALALKERGRQPTTEEEWTNLVCHPEVRPPTAGAPRDGSRSRKRGRSRSKENRNKQMKADQQGPKEVQPKTTASASATLTTQALEPRPKATGNAQLPTTLNIRQPQAPSHYQQQQQQDNNNHWRNNNATQGQGRNASRNNYRGNRGRGQNQPSRGQYQQRGNNRGNSYQPSNDDREQAGSSNQRERTPSTKCIITSVHIVKVKDYIRSLSPGLC